MGIFKPLLRRKNLEEINSKESELGRVLSLFDLIFLGVGCTLGVGVYVLPGIVAKELSGPGVVISFFIAALTSVLAGLCFAEFGARAPKAGSAYIYSYVTVGEFVAFIIGWSLIIEYIIGAASVARGLSVYLDNLAGNPMQAFYRNIYEFKDTTIMEEYLDMFAFFVTLFVTICLAFGVKESMFLNNILTLSNVGVVLFVIGLGSTQIDFKNWSLSKEELPAWAGEGGFLPYGISGVLKGAATCFYGYIGFDVISTTGEEVHNPQRSLPIAIIVSLAVVFMAYSGLSAILTLMWPYYLQDVEAPLPYVFSEVGLGWAAWIVAFGGIFGLLACLYSGMFPLPRIIYAMANDGLLFSWLGSVHPRFRTPFIGTLLSGFIASCMAAVFKLRQLVDLNSLVTLLAYTLVSACVLILRYREEVDEPRSVTHEYVEHTHLISKKIRVTCYGLIQHLFNRGAVSLPTKVTSVVACVVTSFYCFLCIVLSVLLVQGEAGILDGDVTLLAFVFVLVLLMILCLTSLHQQPSSTNNLAFKVPFVPLLPALSLFLNIYLMATLDFSTWIQFIIWLGIGFFIYFGYSINHSHERHVTSPFSYEIIRSDDEILISTPSSSGL